MQCNVVQTSWLDIQRAMHSLVLYSQPHTFKLWWLVLLQCTLWHFVYPRRTSPDEWRTTNAYSPIVACTKPLKKPENVASYSGKNTKEIGSSPTCTPFPTGWPDFDDFKTILSPFTRHKSHFSTSIFSHWIYLLLNIYKAFSCQCICIFIHLFYLRYLRYFHDAFPPT